MRRFLMGLWALVVVGLLIAALVVHQQRPTEPDSAGVLRSVRAVVPGMFTYGVPSIAPDEEAMTDQLVAKHEASAEKTAALIKEEGVRATGRIVAAAVQKVTASEATVLVFLNASIATKASPTPQDRGSRLSVRVVRQHDAWLVAAVDSL